MGVLSAFIPEPRPIGRYVLFDEIASGGMASVFIGRLVGTAGFSRTVAIKRPHRHLLEDRNAVSMFLDEARLASRVQHPNVVGVHDIIAIDGELLLVMDYVHGQSLSRLARLAREYDRNVPVAVATALVIGVLNGLHAAHEATSEYGNPLRLVHRDVSPQNILVGVDGVPRVVDFGIAKAAERLQTTTEGQLKGKAAYLAPEQINDAPVDRRADVYAASVVLWELLAGRRLFLDGNAFETMRLVLEAAHESPSRYQPAVPSAVDAVVLRSLAADPDHRFPTARDMAIALERATRQASAREIGEWVEALAGDELRGRARRIAEIERASSPRLARPSETEPSSPQDEISTVYESAPSPARLAPAPARRRRRLGLAIAAAMFTGGAAATSIWWGTASKTRAEIPAMPPQSPAVSDPVSALAVPPTVVPASPQPSSRAPSRLRAPTARATSAPAKVAAPRCAKPFTIARDGTKIPKPECL